ncbi:MAG: hypothetical protein VYE40_02655 [Myxococcota bacterium]|jgi:hypothetical protein|nr:hypothetical protein [Myxococcota bacterium]
MYLIVGHVRGGFAQVKSNGEWSSRDITTRGQQHLREVSLRNWTHALLLITSHDGQTSLIEFTPQENDTLFYTGAFGAMGSCQRNAIQGSSDALKAIFEKSPYGLCA